MIMMIIIVIAIIIAVVDLVLSWGGWLDIGDIDG